MSSWRRRFSSKLVSAEAAVAQVKNGDRIYMGSMGAEPMRLVRALADSALEDVEIVQLKGGGEASSLVAQARSRFRLKTFFLGGRKEDPPGTSAADSVPLFHSEIPLFFKNRRIPIDIAMIQVSEPDRFGQVSLGISVDITLAAVECARTVIAQVNPHMPRTLGQTFVPVDSIQFLVDAAEELPELAAFDLTDGEDRISQYCSELIGNGSVIQAGFAGISKGLTKYLRDHRDLGVHSEMITDSVIDLIEAGVITNAHKRFIKGKSVTTFCLGTRRLYDYVNNNPLFEFQPSDVVLDPSRIASNDQVVAINIALQVDVRGQIRQGSMGWTAFEGSGGEQDFMRGASLSRRGRSIVCLHAVDAQGHSNITTGFGRRAGVIMNRGDVNYVVTEYGIAYLGGKSIRERVMALVEVAHPDHRETLMREARDLGFVYPNQVYVRTASPELRERIRTDVVFKGGLKAHVRAIKPTDESMLRDLFYHMSKSSVYFRYFSPRRSMPHQNVHKYVTLDENDGLSVVVTTGPRETRRMIAEGRYVWSGDDHAELPDVALMVDEDHHGFGIGTFLLTYLAQLAKERGVKGFKADVLTSNAPAMKLLDRIPYVIHRRHEDNSLAIWFRFDELKEAPGQDM